MTQSDSKFISKIKNEKIKFTLAHIYALQFLEDLPCYVSVYDREGVLRYINPAMLHALGVPRAEDLVGRVNIHRLKGPDFDLYQLPQRLQTALQGRTDYAFDVPLPTRENATAWNTSRTRQFGSVVVFPIYDANGEVDEVGILFFPNRILSADPNVLKCKEWIDCHWADPFDLEELAFRCSLSKNHLSKIFKRFFGITPFQYYRQVKFDNLRLKLLERDLNVEGAFKACGLDYNGTQARVFREMFGLSPLAYKKSFKDDE